MKFYVGETPFIIADQKLPKEVEESSYVMGAATAKTICKHYEMKRDGQTQGNIRMVFYVSDYEGTVSEVKKSFKLIEAAGGLVIKNDKLLFIKRLGKWDLPKGKMEKGELVAETALREVEEECQITASLDRFVGSTWHTYQHKGHDILKNTHWYKMVCLNDSQMQPQTEEHIEEVCWLDADEIRNTVFPNTYPTIKDIYEAYLLG